MNNIFKPSKQSFNIKQPRRRNQNHKRNVSLNDNVLLDFSHQLDQMLGRKSDVYSQSKVPFRITKRLQSKFPKQKIFTHAKKYHTLENQRRKTQDSRQISNLYRQKRQSTNSQASRQVRREISQLKTKLEIQKAVNQKQMQYKIESLMNRFQSFEIDRLNRSYQSRSSYSQSPQPLPIILQPSQPNYPPYYPPPPMYHHYNTNQYDTIQRPREETNSRYQIFKQTRNYNPYFRNRKKPKFSSPIIYQKNKKIIRKCFIAVYFITCLKKLNKNIVRSRRLMFESFWPQKFQVHMQNLKQIFKFYTKKFFKNVIKIQNSLHFITEQVQLRQKSVTKKRQLIRQLLANLFDELSQLIGESKNIQKIYVKNQGKNKLNFLNILHIFCKHGAFIKDQLMTQFQLNDSCVSEINGYLRMDKHLQKAQIVNFIFLKLLLFNMILQPMKVAKSQIAKYQEPEVIASNFHLLGSIIYHIFVELRTRYIQNVPSQNYNLGNWKKYKKKFNYIACPPLILKQALNSDGKCSVSKNEMITGVLSRQKARAIYGDWGKQVKLCSKMVKQIHQQLVQYHLKLVQQIM